MEHRAQGMEHRAQIPWILKLRIGYSLLLLKEEYP
jgi:hypothetical protein